MELLIILILMGVAAYYFGKAKWGDNPPMPGAFSNRGSSHSIKQLIERNLDCFPDRRTRHHDPILLNQEAKVLIWFGAIVIQARSQYLDEAPDLRSSIKIVETAYPQWDGSDQRTLAFTLVEGLSHMWIRYPGLMSRIYSPDNKQILLTLNKHMVVTLNQ